MRIVGVFTSSLDSHIESPRLFKHLVSPVTICRGQWTKVTLCDLRHATAVCHLPKQLDEKVAELHFLALGAALTVFAQEHPSSFLPDVVVFHEPVLLQLDLLTY